MSKKQVILVSISQVKKVHEQLKALSSNPSKKRRKSLGPMLDLTDPLFLPTSLAPPPVPDTKKKAKKKAMKAAEAASTPVKKPGKVRTAGAAAPAPAKKLAR